MYFRIVRSTSRTTGRVSANSASAGAMDNHSQSVIIELNKQISELKMTVDGLEKERDFYFGKLRDIEILVQEELDAAEQHPEEHVELPIMKDIQTILYSTEVGCFIVWIRNPFPITDTGVLFLIRRALKYPQRTTYPVVTMMNTMMRPFSLHIT